jgi:hypothetical protein
LDVSVLFQAAVDRPNLRFNLDTANQFVARDHLPLSTVRSRQCGVQPWDELGG